MTDPNGELLWHLALLDDWEHALAEGEYRVSTLGKTLDEVGFVHCSSRAQLDGVATSFYRDVDQPLVALQIDPGLLTATVRLEPVAGPGSEAFPHIYGPIPVAAVQQVHPARVGDELILDPPPE